MKPLNNFEGGELIIIETNETIYDETSNNDNDFDGSMHKRKLELKKRLKMYYLVTSIYNIKNATLGEHVMDFTRVLIF